MNKKGQLTVPIPGLIILVAIATILGLAFLGVVIDFTENIRNDPNSSSTVVTIVLLIPLLYVLLIIGLIGLPAILLFEKANN